ncbi:MAG: hypothetical protein V2I43_19180 [Parvularcula sp.]|nr:hypothetical protein [Parvularcula sp.]
MTPQQGYLRYEIDLLLHETDGFEEYTFDELFDAQMVINPSDGRRYLGIARSQALWADRHFAVEEWSEARLAVYNCRCHLIKGLLGVVRCDELAKAASRAGKPGRPEETKDRIHDEALYLMAAPYRERHGGSVDGAIEATLADNDRLATHFRGRRATALRSAYYRAKKRLERDT